MLDYNAAMFITRIQSFYAWLPFKELIEESDENDVKIGRSSLVGVWNWFKLFPPNKQPEDSTVFNIPCLFRYTFTEIMFYNFSLEYTFEIKYSIAFFSLNLNISHHTIYFKYNF